ncbi:FtsQ-type POTRA domain-containing protein [Salinibacterium hongtaonis]|nr:FtsQ-type POTRA domain-containing protein [Salinibacterium hongtaonis]
MKRPEGFDSSAAARQVPPAPVTSASPEEGGLSGGATPMGAKPAKSLSAKSTLRRLPARSRQPADRDSAGDAPVVVPKRATKSRPVSNPVESAADAAKRARREARRATRARRRFEKSEVRRFTRRARHRRVAWLAAGGTVAVFAALITVAVFSPLLSLDTIEVTGTSRIDPAAVVDSVDGQMGTPLALVDLDRLTRELGEFPLIRSYVTEMVPPHTMVIHITERQPVGAIIVGDGYRLVDPAGVVVEKSDTRPPGVPLLELVGADEDSTTFDSVVEVLLALPPEVLATVDSVTASTMDDVTLVFGGVGQRVVWGSADRSELKARVLEKLIANQDPAIAVEYDVTAPLSAVVRPL